MIIKKIGHCCFYIEENGVGILTDPGMYSSGQDEITGISLIIITHEHGDHFHIESVKKVLANNPDATIITNSAVAKLLEQEGIQSQVVEDGQNTEVAGITIAGFGKDHAVIYKTIPVVMNTGYLIAGQFFLPGDAFVQPHVPVEILGMPIAGPWMKLSESLEWAIAMKPKMCIPVHDAILSNPTWLQGMIKNILQQEGIDFRPMVPEESVEL